MKHHWALPWIPTTANRVLRQHWATTAKNKKDWRLRVLVKCGFRRSFQTHPVKLRINVHRLRLQDKDNAYASAKPIIDALKWHGWMFDDSPAYLDVEVVETKVKLRKDRKTVIDWELLEPAKKAGEA